MCHCILSNVSDIGRVFLAEYYSFYCRGELPQFSTDKWQPETCAAISHAASIS